MRRRDSGEKCSLPILDVPPTKSAATSLSEALKVVFEWRIAERVTVVRQDAREGNGTTAAWREMGIGGAE
jgi:hypothetical protein